MCKSHSMVLHVTLHNIPSNPCRLDMMIVRASEMSDYVQSKSVRVRSTSPGRSCLESVNIALAQDNLLTSEQTKSRAMCILSYRRVLFFSGGLMQAVFGCTDYKLQV